MKRFLIISALTLGATSVHAQFTLDGQYRARGELRNGFKKPILKDQDPALFIEHRARLISGYKNEKLGFKFSIQDVRIWGETGQINKSDHLLSVHEAYGEFYASEKSTFRIGRQAFNYDGQRFFGGLDWAMQGRSLDAVKYIYKTEDNLQLDVFAAWNQEGFTDGNPEPKKLVGTNYTPTAGGGLNGVGSETNLGRVFNLPLPKSQLGAYFKYQFSNGDISVLVLDDFYNANDSTKETYSNITTGITPNFSFGDLKLGGEFYITTGSAGKVYDTESLSYKNIDLSGYMFGAYVQYTGIFSSPSIGIDYVTGDKEASTTEVEGWSPKYGTNHKFYGFMDYFYVGNPHGGGNAASAGLIDLYLKTKMSLGEKTSLLAHFHHFMAETARTSAANGNTYDGSLATEIDLVFIRSLAKGVALKVGYSQMFGISDTLKLLKFNNPDAAINGTQNWAWVMIAFSPSFL